MKCKGIFHQPGVPILITVIQFHVDSMVEGLITLNDALNAQKLLFIEQFVLSHKSYSEYVYPETLDMNYCTLNSLEKIKEWVRYLWV